MRIALLVLVTLLVVFLLMVSGYAQAHHMTSPVIRGSEHPEQIADQRAWLMQLIASTSSGGDSELVKKQVVFHRHALGLDGFEHTALSDFRTRYDQLLLDYNNSIKPSPKTGATAYQQIAQRQLYNDIGQLVDDTVGYLKRNLPEAQWAAVIKQVQVAKTRMTITAEKLPVISNNSVTFGNSSQAGYTQYTALDTDGTYWYQTVYMYGASAAQWWCVWDQYHGQWQPPGCPVQHDFYLSNQLNGQGYTNLHVGTEYSPSQYVSFSAGNRSPVLNNGQESSVSAGTVICTIAGTILAAYYKFFILPAHELVAWNGTGQAGLCNLYPTCTNPRPWAIDGTWLIDISGKCAVAYNCFSACVRSISTLTWSCPSSFTGAYCFDLPVRTYAPCTPHP